MNLTEQTALETRCCGPMTSGETRGVQRLEASASTPVMSMPLRYCIASKCMAWRWYTGVSREALGYCGLAGKPELA